MRFSLSILVALYINSVSLPAVADHSTAKGEWPVYAGDFASTKYSPLTQINASNFKRLKVAWKWNSPDNELKKKLKNQDPGPNESTPLMIGGVLYTSTGLNQVAAIDAVTGKTLWLYTPKSYGGVHRGVAYWESGSDKRILMTLRDSHLLALNAMTGKPVATFGSGGQVDLVKSMRNVWRRDIVAQTSPPIVCGDIIVVSSAVDDFQDRKEMPPGDIRGFDVRTGKLLWTFHTVPVDGEFGADTWKEGSNKYTGAANCWATMSYDPGLGYVYIPLGTPNNDWYAGHRPGSGLFGECLLCLSAKTGKRVWHFQLAHHGEWDYDLPCAPVLCDVKVNGRNVKAVAQCTKQAFCFVFDRVTGKPLWPIVEKPVPPTTMPGDTAWPTQPFATKPLPFDLQGATEDNLIDFTPELRAEAKEILNKYNHGPLYTPPSEQHTIEMPGWVGGASWAATSCDPETGTLYVPSINNPMYSSLKRPESLDATVDYLLGESGPTIDGPRGLPLFKPPYGRITAINLNTGDNRWMTPHGEGPRKHPAIKHLKLPPLGDNRRGYLLVTKTLLIGFKEGSWFNTLPPKYPAKVRAFDKATGKLLAEVDVKYHTTGSPITYMAGGKQYIAFPTGGGREPASLIALRLP